MRRHARALIMIAVLVILGAVILGIQNIKIGDFERGSDTILGLSLGLDLQGGSHLVYRAVDTETGEPIIPAKDEMEALKRSIERRVNASGLGEPIIQLLGDDRLLIQLPGVRDPGRAKKLIGETAQLVFKHRRLNVPRRIEEITSADIVGVTVAPYLPEDQEPSTLGEGSSAEEAQLTPADPSAGEPQASTIEPSPDATLAPSTEPTADDPSVSSAEPATEATEDPSTQETEGLSEEPVEEQPDQIPALVVEFTEVGAEKFAVIVGRLRESLGIDENFNPLEADDTVYPSSISISVDGAASRTFQLEFGGQLGFLAAQLGADPRELLGPPFISRIDGTNQFSLYFGSVASNLEQAQEILGENPNILFSEEIQGKVDEDFGLTGDDLSNAYAGQHTASGAPIVNIEFNDFGARLFGELTEEIVAKQELTGQQDQIAIFLDNEELIAPTVQTAITAGAAFIQGRDFTLDRVSDLALELKSGRLPVAIELTRERDVDAILGADSLAKSVVAGAVGLALVLLFMTLYYRAPGVIASAALLVYAILILAIFKILPVTLTLSGVGAIILSIGMAVDANILIFERMKDELRAGRTLMSAINIGFNRAWPAIRDSNVSTLITCGILFYFSSRLGEGTFQGFAGALAIGVLLSMFSAITVSRTFLRVVATTTLARRLGLFVPLAGSQLPQLQTVTPRPSELGDAPNVQTGEAPLPGE